MNGRPIGEALAAALALFVLAMAVAFARAHC